MTVPGQCSAILEIDRTASDGSPVPPLAIDSLRLMALCVPDLWFGFVLTGKDGSILQGGSSHEVRIAFINEVDARAKFPVRASILVGNGVKSIGVLRIRSWDAP